MTDDERRVYGVLPRERRRRRRQLRCMDEFDIRDATGLCGCRVEMAIEALVLQGRVHEGDRGYWVYES